MDIESYIKDLSPELQEKVRACGSVGELPDEALAAIAGGDDPEAGGCKDPIKCPKCGSTHVTVDYRTYMFLCLACGNEWLF